MRSYLTSIIAVLIFALVSIAISDDINSVDELKTLKDIVEEKMRSAIPMSVPVIVDMNTGDNWLQAH